MKKSELSRALIEFKTCSEVDRKAYGFEATNIRLPCAEENLPSIIKDFCSTHGILLKTSPAHEPQSNSCAVRLIQQDWTYDRVYYFYPNYPCSYGWSSLQCQLAA